MLGNSGALKISRVFPVVRRSDLSVCAASQTPIKRAISMRSN
jgi:hypothetical protein